MKPRRPFGRVLMELHYQLRTEGDSPIRQGLAIGIGVWIGVTPLYGLHLLICAVTARLLGLSRILTYLAAHISNPITLPFLLWAEFGVGYFLRNGRWPRLSLEEARSLTLWSFGLDLVVGSLIIGTLLGLVLGFLGYRAALRSQVVSPRRKILEETSKLYAECGILQWEFVRGKLRHDPLYEHALRPGLLPQHGRLLDLGCGRGILLAVLHTAGEMQDVELVGIEANRRAAAVARRALGQAARIAVADLSQYDPEPCSSAILFDVLHYLDPAAQARLLGRVCEALEPGGVLLIREPDDRPEWRFRLTRWQERWSATMRGKWKTPFHFRGAREWSEMLEAHGLEVRVSPLWHGTPFSNVLIEAFKR